MNRDTIRRELGIDLVLAEASTRARQAGRQPDEPAPVYQVIETFWDVDDPNGSSMVIPWFRIP